MAMSVMFNYFKVLLIQLVNRFRGNRLSEIKFPFSPRYNSLKITILIQDSTR